MKYENLKKIIDGSDERSLIYQSVGVLYPAGNNEYAEELLGRHNTPMEIFNEAYFDLAKPVQFEKMRAKAFFKLIHMSEKLCVKRENRGHVGLCARTPTLESLVSFVCSHFDMSGGERLMIFRIEKNGTSRCVYESLGESMVSCCIRTDEVYAIAKKNRKANYVVMHSHPLGDPTPSIEDERANNILKKLFDFSESRLIVHVIVSKTGDGIRYRCIDSDGEYFREHTFAEILSSSMI